MNRRRTALAVGLGACLIAAMSHAGDRVGRDGAGKNRGRAEVVREIQERFSEDKPAVSLGMPGGSCFDMCQHRSQEVLHNCLNAGGTPAECGEQAQAALQHCLETECGPPPCEIACHQAADQAFQDCIAAGGGEEECHDQARDVLWTCLQDNCDVEPPQPSCPRQCHHQAERQYHDCVEAGGNQEECAMAARQSLFNCLRDTCGIDPPPDPPCPLTCQRDAEHAFHACVEAGGTQEACAEASRALLHACLRDRCGIDVPPEPPCEARCAHHAEHVFRECRENGGTIEDCRAAAHEALRICLQEECGIEPPPPPCPVVCKREAEQAYQDCVDAGGDPETCAEQARAGLQQCLEVRCGIVPSCEHRCEVEAIRVFHECIDGGGTPEVCRSQAHAYLETCIADCP